MPDGATAKSQARELDESVERFIEIVNALDESQLRKPLGRWTPRDVVAHLIGWNRYTLRGCHELREGRLPFYDVDPGENYAKVNAVLIREIPSEEKSMLLEGLRSSCAELKDYLLALVPDDWERDFGVRHRGKTVTIRNSVDELIEDYRHHERQVADWAATGGD
jgi:DinB superfamily